MKGQAHYLSWESQNEFIELSGESVQKAILAEKEKVIYYSDIYDAVPHASNHDQGVNIAIYYLHKRQCYI